MTSSHQTMHPTTLHTAMEAEMEKILGCIHCGLCLPACPTYGQVGNENDSPRGRIYLMRAVAEGRLDLESPTLSRHLDLCLGCRACETACPAGVRYGYLLESARETLLNHVKSRSFDPQKKMLGFSLRHIFPSPTRLARVFNFLRAVRGNFLTRFALRGGWLRKLTPQTDFALSLLAATQPAPWDGGTKNWQVDPEKLPRAKPEEQQSVAVFTGCVMEGLFQATNRATTRVLAVNGYRPVEVGTQVCCGALHAHAGDLTNARELARKNIDAFEAFLASSRDAREALLMPPTIIINAAGCGALLKEYGELLKDDTRYAARAEAFSRRVRDVTEFLAEKEIRRGAEIAEKVTFDAPCHLYHAQRVTAAPQKVLAGIPGIEYRPLDGMQDCCGGAGIYNLSEPEMSAGILSEKIGKVKATGASILATANPGCQMQLGAGVRLHGADCQVMHVVDLLDESYRRAGYYKE